ncbi:MAG: IS110 family transposase [Tannerellaceae bacterium]|nr:IS110 family transposase [Tannerellaceae bacterium]
MKRFLFIGIDFSKSKFDVSVMECIDRANVAQATFDNTVTGYGAFLKWTALQSKIKRDDWRFCGEHTGLYSRGLSDFLAQKQLFIWLENPLQIKQCSGIKRKKNDRFDSPVIAEYACRYIDRAVAYSPAEKAIDALQLLVSYRSRLVKSRVALEVAASEMRRVVTRNTTARFVYESSMREVERIRKQIDGVEKKMHETVMQSSLKENYLLITSIKGVGMQTAVAMIVHTNSFAGFQTARQIASYCGCAPFPNESGTVDKGSHISHLANRELKVLLTQCAVSAMRHNRELSAYAQRKIAAGKSRRLVINNVRNKLIQRIFAVVTGKVPYREDYLNPLADCA